MTKILFVCAGNICRSPMAEFFMKRFATDAGCLDQFYIESAAVTDDEVGNRVYAPVYTRIWKRGADCSKKTARQLTREDYDRFDYLIGMDSSNIEGMKEICGGDPEGKMSMLLDWTEAPREIADPWYTREFDTAEIQIEAGCKALLKKLKKAQPE